jgi:WhiB family transcriptional regulator, redox-sensing transcriptional regulator
VSAAAATPGVTGAGWQQWAACAAAGVDPEWFFPEPGQRATRARRNCARCPVASACLADALATREEHGIRAGLTALQRDRLRRGRGGRAR